MYTLPREENDDMAATSEFPSRNLTFEWGRTAPDDLAKIGDSIDTKCVGIFATGSLILGIAAAVTDIAVDLTILPLILAGIAYLVVLVSSWLLLLPKEFSGPDDPSILRESYWGMDPEEAQLDYWKHVEEAYRDTYRKVRIKGRLLKYAVVGLGVEVLFLAAWLVLATAFGGPACGGLAGP